MMASRIAELATQVTELLMRENAVRIDHEQVGNYMTVQQICDELCIYVGDWTKVKNEILRKGMSICYLPGKGHFLGHKGEEVTNFVYKYKIARGFVRHMREYKEAIETASPEAKDWIGRRFKDFSLEKEEDPTDDERAR